MSWGNSTSPYGGFGWLSANPGGATFYKYGLPYDSANTGSENASFQLAMEEASGDVASEESSPVTLTAAGTPTYGQAGTDAYVNFTGIKFNANGDYFDNNAAISHLDLGTADFTIEWVMKLGTTAQDSNVMYAYTGANHGFVVTIQGILRTYFYFEATDSTSSAIQLDMSSVFDDAMHKHRLVASGRGTAGALLEYFIDGVSQGSAGFTGLNAKSIPGGRALIGWNQAAAYKCDGTLYEFRVTPSSTANSGGSGGG